MLKKDLFEAYYFGEIPDELKKQLECFADIHCDNNTNKWWFSLGWIMARRINEIREAMGIDAD